jgi:hypothetical protein
MNYRHAVLLISPLLLVATFVGLSVYNHGGDAGRALDVGLSALMVGGSVMVLALLLLPWPPAWGRKPGMMAGSLFAIGLLGLGALSAVESTGRPVPAATLLDTMFVALFVAGMFLHGREVRNRGVQNKEAGPG